MDTFRRAGLIAVCLIALGWMLAAPALACSPPFAKPTIAPLGPDQVVVVGTIGERVQGGRLLHVERAYNGAVMTTPIVIAFKEGEPIGDCSYPVSTGARLMIAPYREPDGRLTADMLTLQANPASEGRPYVAEAESLLGPGIVPVVNATADLPGYPLPRMGLVLAGIGIIVLGLVAAMSWWRRPSPRLD